MKLIAFLTAISITLFIASCADLSGKKNAREVVYLDDKLLQTDQNASALENQSLTSSRQTSISLRKGSGDSTTTAPDGSQITLMTDSAGNKTESRCFNNHPLVACIVVSTTNKGDKQVSVYGQNGSVKNSIPENIVNNALTISANELASAVGIFEGKKQTNFPNVVLQKPQTSQPLQPMPSYKFPAQRALPPESEPVNDNNQTADSVVDDPPPNTVKTEAPQAAQNRQPESSQDN